MRSKIFTRHKRSSFGWQAFLRSCIGCFVLQSATTKAIEGIEVERIVPMTCTNGLRQGVEGEVVEENVGVDKGEVGDAAHVVFYRVATDLHVSVALNAIGRDIQQAMVEAVVEGERIGRRGGPQHQFVGRIASDDATTEIGTGERTPLVAQTEGSTAIGPRVEVGKRRVHHLHIATTHAEAMATGIGEFGVSHPQASVHGTEGIARHIVDDRVFDGEFVQSSIGRVAPYAPPSAMDIDKVQMVVVAGCS